MARQISEGLAFLHDQNVVHRDLKTANVILDEELRLVLSIFTGLYNIYSVLYTILYCTRLYYILY